MMLIGILYIPQYTREYEMRRILTQQKSISLSVSPHLWVTQTKNGGLLEVSRFRIYLTTHQVEEYTRIADDSVVIGTLLPGVQANNSYRLPLKIQSISPLQSQSSTGFSSNDIRKAMYGVKRGIEKRIFSYFSQQEGQLFLGITLGREITDENLLTALKRTGLSHVAVASGSNIAIVISLVASLAIRMRVSRRFQILGALVLSFLYVCLVGFEPSLLRAYVLIIITSLFTVLGRPSSSRIALLYAIGVLLLADPFMLFSLSFQLSVAATYGVAIFYKEVFPPEVDDGHGNSQEGILLILGDTIKTTWCAFLFTTPLILMLSGEVSVVGIIANLVLVWLIPFILIGGLIAIFTSFFLPPVFMALIASIFGILIHLFIGYINIFSSLPLATLVVIQPSNYGILLVYSTLVGWGMWQCSGHNE